MNDLEYRSTVVRMSRLAAAGLMSAALVAYNDGGTPHDYVQDARMFNGPAVSQATTGPSTTATSLSLYRT